MYSNQTKKKLHKLKVRLILHINTRSVYTVCVRQIYTHDQVRVVVIVVSCTCIARIEPNVELVEYSLVLVRERGSQTYSRSLSLFVRQTQFAHVVRFSLSLSLSLSSHIALWLMPKAQVCQHYMYLMVLFLQRTEERKRVRERGKNNETLTDTERNENVVEFAHQPKNHSWSTLCDKFSSLFEMSDLFFFPNVA